MTAVGRPIRLLPPPPAREMFARAAALERRSVELAIERQSRRVRLLGREIAMLVERHADKHLEERDA